MNNQKGASGAMPRRGSKAAGTLLILTFATLVAPTAIAGCANETGQGPTWTAHPGVATPQDNGTGTGTGSGSAMQAAWAARPAYVRQDARTEEAYAYAMAAPAVLQWMPCYCGCTTMGHGSNLDCFFKPALAGGANLRFEEHASYCGICIDTALMAKRMSAEGQSLRAIRDAIDAEFGGAAPGTDTALPPA